MLLDGEPPSATAALVAARRAHLALLVDHDPDGARDESAKALAIAREVGAVVCRIHYADVLLWHGEWQQADEELTAAVAELGAIRPGREADPLVRVAELRRRQGRVREAEELLAQAASHHLHALVEGLFALDRGDAETAQDAAARLLRRIGAADRFERVAATDARRSR